MADSIHFARWLSQFSEEDVVFEVVSSSPHMRLSQALSDQMQHSPTVSMTWVSRHLSFLFWWLDRFLSDWIRGAFVAYRILRFKPEVVHALELQNAGYATRRAFQILGKRKPKLLVTNYGSDIFWFSRIPKHKRKLVSLLSQADGYSAECRRDYILASQMAPKLRMMPLMPNAGGFARSPLENSRRSKIAVKGYENFWGKAIFVLDTLASMSDELQEVEVVFFGSDPGLIRVLRDSSRCNGLRVTSFGSGALQHEKVLDLFEESLMYIGHSLSDGISTSMLEAMSMGAIPVQTRTACADEWIINNETGYILEPFDSSSLKLAVRSILNGDFNSEVARQKNLSVIQSRCNSDELASVAMSYYTALITKS
jgi:glycosyltransferase involved in cell wall biosynthesis